MIARAAHEENGLHTRCQSSLAPSLKIDKTYHASFGGALLRLEENGVPCGTMIHVRTLHFGVWELYKSTCQQMLLSRYHRMLKEDS